jgi:hypothetical protein
VSFFNHILELIIIRIFSPSELKSKYLLEEFEGWETLDTESLSELFVFSDVNLGEGKWWVSGG